MSLNKFEQMNSEILDPLTKKQEIKNTRRISQETCCSDLDRNLKEFKMSIESDSPKNSLSQSNSNSSADILATDKESISDKESSSFDYKYYTKKNENSPENGQEIFGENILGKEYYENIRNTRRKNKNFVLKSEIISGYIYENSNGYNNKTNNSIYEYLKDNIDFYINEYNSLSEINNLNNEIDFQSDFYTVNSNYFSNHGGDNGFRLNKTANISQNDYYNNSYSVNQLPIEKNINALNIIIKIGRASCRERV